MQSLHRFTFAAAVLGFVSTAPGVAQTETVFGLTNPVSQASGWGASAAILDDVDGDGTADLLVGAPGFGGGVAASVHSGASGAHLYSVMASNAPMFFGDAVFPMLDETGDGISEIMSLRSQSGNPNSGPGTITVHDGADGSEIRSVSIAAGATLQAHSQTDAYSPGDIDGDGYGDLLCVTAGLQSPGAARPVTALSGLTGELLYVAEHAADVSIGAFTSVSDHDGDGQDDFAVATRQASVGAVEIFSAATGLLLSAFPCSAVDQITNNHEPFVAVSDLDGDGLKDLAVGGLFTGFAAIASSATGSTIRDWSVVASGTLSFGSRLIEVGDLTGDGHRDLLAFQAFGDFQNDPFVAALDPVTGDVLFHEFIPGLVGGYTGDERLMAIDASLDPLGFPLFAFQSAPPSEVKVQRILPEIGDADCFGAADAMGVMAQLTARGAPRVQGPSRLSLTLTDAQPGGFAAILFGLERTVFPIGPADLCVGMTPGLIRLGNLSTAGDATLDVSLSALGAAAFEDWTFQGVFRDAVLGVRATNAVTFTAAP